MSRCLEKGKERRKEAFFNMSGCLFNLQVVCIIHEHMLINRSCHFRIPCIVRMDLITTLSVAKVLIVCQIAATQGVKRIDYGLGGK